MGIEKYLFNVVTARGRFLGQAFQAMDEKGNTKILTTSHQARLNEQESFKLLPYLGKSLTIARSSFQYWNNGDQDCDVAELPLKRYTGGIHLAKSSGESKRLIVPSSRGYPNEAARMLVVCPLQVENVDFGDEHTMFYRAWVESERTFFGNSGAPVLNEQYNVIAIVQAILTGYTLPYVGVAQQIDWNFE